MRVGKRAARREVQKHIDFTDRAGAELKKIELVRTFTLLLVQFELKLEAARLALSSVHGEPN